MPPAAIATANTGALLLPLARAALRAAWRAGGGRGARCVASKKSDLRVGPHATPDASFRSRSQLLAVALEEAPAVGSTQHQHLLREERPELRGVAPSAVLEGPRHAARSAQGRDENLSCSAWAAYGGCDGDNGKDPAWMRAHCALSCGVCGDGAG